MILTLEKDHSMYKTLSICGFRGFASNQNLSLAIPNGEYGSGLTIVVGANNSGKSTIWETFRALSSPSVSFTEGKRNKKAGNKVFISITDTEGTQTSLQTVQSGGSETKKDGVFNCFSLQSRRNFNPFFGKALINRRDYITHMMPLSGQRSNNNNNFSNRLFEINTNVEKRNSFNKDLFDVLGYNLDWTIEQSDHGEYYLKITFNGVTHNSDGAGEGLLSIFTIVDALYDSANNDIVTIDEPELSLHPALQRRLFDLILKYSRNRQIIIFTHSPFFIGWEAIINGAEFARVCKEKDETKIYQLSKNSKECISKFIEDQHNLRTLGLEATEAFFLDDNIILTEGQDDVFYYKNYFMKRCTNNQLNFFGWGVGGADKMQFMANILNDLGYKKVIGILDGDKMETAKNLNKEFPKFIFLTIPAKDVRDKNKSPEKDAVSGLFSTNGQLKQEYEQDMDKITNDIFNYLEQTLCQPQN